MSRPRPTTEEAATDALRLLVVLPFPPAAAGTHGGARATGQLIERLAVRHEVAVVHLRGPDERPVDETLRRRCALVEEVMRSEPGSALARGRRKADGWLALMRGTPLWASDLAVPEFAVRLRAVAERFRPDVVQFEFPVMAQYLAALRDCDCVRILVDHDFALGAAREVRARSRGLSRLRARLDERAWARFERNAIDRMDAVVVFTERDRAGLAALGGAAPVLRVPLGTPLPPKPLDPLGGTPPQALFVSSFIHPPNVDAAVRLARGVMPRVWETRPEVRLVLVGDGPPPEVTALAGSRVDVTGRVPDVAPYLDAATAVVAPLRHGGGMRVKVLEALAGGKALVATPLAVTGFPLTDGENVLLAESDDELAHAIVRVVADPELRRSLAAAARTWAEANLHWSRSIDAYERLYRSLTERSSAAAAARA